MSDDKSNRRNFLLNLLKVSGQVTLASAATYSLGLVTSISKDKKFGNLTAGAKGTITCYCGQQDGICYQKLNGPDGCYTPNWDCYSATMPDPPGCDN